MAVNAVTAAAAPPRSAIAWLWTLLPSQAGALSVLLPCRAQRRMLSADGERRTIESRLNLVEGIGRYEEWPQEIRYGIFGAWQTVKLSS
jgi:hypothetical protein